MGGSSYSDDMYKARGTDRAAKGVTAFDYSAKVSSGAVAFKVHERLDPKGIIRESRDSAAHPESLAVAVVFDVTGSMGGVPRELQTKIPQLMGLLMRGGYVEHPQVLFGAVGDFDADRVPLQIGQFESGVEMDDDINNIVLEGGGGGTYQESYQNVFYFFAHKTSIDCFEKRGKKGYLFVIGDEMPYAASTKDELSKILGEHAQADVTVEESIRACREKYNVFFVIPTEGTSHGTDPKLKARWGELVGGQNVIMLKNNSAVCEAIASAIGICEGTVDVDGVRRDLHASGASARIVGDVTDALAPLAASTSLAKVGSGNLPELYHDPGTSVRL